MRKLAVLITIVGLLSGCATWDRTNIWIYETFVDDSLSADHETE